MIKGVSLSLSENGVTDVDDDDEYDDYDYYDELDKHKSSTWRGWWKQKNA
jgi:hypothetical protein